MSEPVYKQMSDERFTKVKVAGDIMLGAVGSMCAQHAVDTMIYVTAMMFLSMDPAHGKTRAEAFEIFAGAVRKTIEATEADQAAILMSGAAGEGIAGEIRS